MPDIFDEVQEDLRAERARALGRRYWGALAALLILILAATGGYVFWQQRSIAAANAVAGRFIDAARLADRAAASPLAGKPDADTAQAASILGTIGNSGPAGYRVLARLRLAALQWQTGQRPQAVATWQSVTDDTAAPALLRDLATLTSAQHQADSADPVLLKQRLLSLTAPGNRWAPMAEQVIAMIDLRTGRLREATAIMQRLATGPLVPEGIRSMATDLLSTLPAPPPPAAAPPHAAAPHG